MGADNADISNNGTYTDNQIDVIKTFDDIYDYLLELESISCAITEYQVLISEASSNVFGGCIMEILSCELEASVNRLTMEYRKLKKSSTNNIKFQEPTTKASIN